MTGIIKESEQLLVNIEKWHKKKGGNLSEEDDCGYGHALRVLGTIAKDNTDLSPEKQKEQLRFKALELIDRYGENIKRVMRLELLEALDIKKEDMDIGL